MSPGTVISASIRGARFMRNSIRLLLFDSAQVMTLLPGPRATVSIGQSAALSSGPRASRPQRPVSRFEVHEQAEAASRDEEDFVRVRVFDFGSGRKPADIHVALIRCVRTGDKTRLVRHGNSVRDVTFGLFRRHGGRRRGRPIHILVRRRGRAVLIRLRRRRVFALGRR